MSTKKPWAGRFSGDTSEVVERYTESISFDKRLWRYDIQGSIAHARMLGRQGIISVEEAQKIVDGLEEIAAEIGHGRFEFHEALEDIHMHIESALIRRIGEVGAKLHTARSRNDQVALDLRLYLRDEVVGLCGLLEQLQLHLVARAEQHLGDIMPGYTHLQRAQPVLLSHHLMAYAQMFERDRLRFSESVSRINVLPLGACALAGTSLPIDRQYVAELLGFDRVSENSLDSVSDRDFALEYLADSAILMMHLSRLAEEVVLWSAVEFSFIELPDAFTTGSSIMPQKKNPDVAELMRGKTGRVYGNLMRLLTTMKGLPLAYNRDMQEDKEAVFDTADTVRSTLHMLIAMLPGIAFNVERMRETAGAAHATATDLAEYLVGKGVAFRTAHEITGRIVRYALDHGKQLTDLNINEYRSFSGRIDEDVYRILDVNVSVDSKRSAGGTSRDEVKRQIESLARRLHRDA
ncbi:MAG TPA: argininosuccinate lyase [Dissulfurispiraceae bacterium]|nr:argininosuccinate lyase [Dissulfurispiraceae bacterium]